MVNPVDPNITNLVLQQSIELAKDFVLQIVGPPARELGELLADQVRSFRFRNKIKILNKAREQLRESGIPPGKVPLKLLLPLLESGSLEEEESMVERWANLLANAANPSFVGDVKMGYIEVLKELSPTDALVLDRLYDYYHDQMHVRGEPTVVFPIEMDGAQLQTIAGVGKDDFERAMDNLFRLNLLTTGGALLVNPQPGEDFYSVTNNISIQFARFGYGFVSACRPGK